MKELIQRKRILFMEYQNTAEGNARRDEIKKELEDIDKDIKATAKAIDRTNPRCTYGNYAHLNHK